MPYHILQSTALPAELSEGLIDLKTALKESVSLCLLFPRCSKYEGGHSTAILTVLSKGLVGFKTVLKESVSFVLVVKL